MLPIIFASALSALSTQAGPVDQTPDLDRFNNYLERALSRGTSMARMVSPGARTEAGSGSVVVRWESEGCIAKMYTNDRIWEFDWTTISNVETTFQGVRLNGPIHDGGTRMVGIYLVVPQGETRDNVWNSMKAVKSACPDRL